MTDAHQVVIARIRSALAAAPPVATEVPRDYETALPGDVDVVALFAERTADYRATIHETSADGLASMVASILTGWGAATLVVPAGVPDAWLAGAAGIVRLVDDPPLAKAQLDAADAVITDAAVAIAETGTIVLDAGPSQGRRALSLLPDRHLCVVPADRIVGTVPEALTRLDPRRPLTWISGPSATSDIELQRVEGVHGPRVLDVVIVR
jgi:L-lactate dehydrogenase complex protein LldG